MNDAEHAALLRRYENFPDRDKWVNEAFFGLRQVAPVLDSLNAGARVLEIGSGPGILLEMLTRRYPHLQVEGVEPVLDDGGFQVVDAYHREIDDAAALHKCGYENFQTEHRYQLIFLINVFEHLPDWRNFLKFAREHLTDDGRCVMLFPNYTFPYEPHFSLPIIINPALTKILFRGMIARYEREHNCAGYWDSVNFVTYMQVKKACVQIGLAHEFDTEILREMLARMHTDFSYRQRQIRLRVIAAIITGLRIDRLFIRGWLRNFTPYLKLELRRADAA